MTEFNMVRHMPGCVMLSLFLALLPGLYAESQTCTVNGGGVLTSFSGEEVTLTLPCKYRLADFTCGGYKVKVTPGNGPLSDQAPFSPVTMTTRIVNTDTGDSLQTRTSLNRLRKYFQEKVDSVWESKRGSLSDLDVIDYDATLNAIALKKNGVFTVTLSAAGDVSITCEADDFSSKPVPESLCGDGTNTAALQEGLAGQFGDTTSATADNYVNFIILNDNTVKQSKSCKALADKFQACDVKTEVVTQCDVIVNDAIRTPCLAESATPLENYYSDCVTSVCDGDPSLMEAMENYINDNCDTGPCAGDTYTVLDDSWRDVDRGYEQKCDKNLTEGWYRFKINGSNAVMPTQCVPVQRCGTIGPYWLDLQGGSLPAVGEERAARVCAHYTIYCCNWNLPTTVKNCGAYLLYKLGPTVTCDETYCAQIADV